jgi:hypothetical protein
MPWIDAIAFDDIDNDDVTRWEHDGKSYAIYRTEEAPSITAASIFATVRRNARPFVKHCEPIRPGS